MNGTYLEKTLSDLCFLALSTDTLHMEPDIHRVDDDSQAQQFGSAALLNFLVYFRWHKADDIVIGGTR